MNLALSNLAWDKNQDEETYKILNEVGVNQIETVFTKIDDWQNLDYYKLIDYKNKLGSNNISVKSAQSLFYGINCLNILDENCILNHFEKLIHFSELVGIETLVFGSPNLRKIENPNFDGVSQIFKKLDNILLNKNVVVVIEPNAITYGGKIFHTVEEIVGFIEHYNLKNIKTMVDTHNSYLMDCDYSNEFTKFLSHINHIHISEVNLKPIQDFESHRKFSKIIKNSGYDKTITYELMKCENLKYELNIFKELYL